MRPDAQLVFGAGTVAGQGGGWLRESFALRSDPPDAEATRDYLSIQGIQRKGR